jgi:hypothetical protein
VRIGVTGHMNLTRATAELVVGALRSHLAGYQAKDLVGVSCMACGADTLFAEVILDLGGALEAILPSPDSRRSDAAPDALLARATSICTMPFATAGCEAYVAANTALLDTIDHLVAVWDGRPPRGAGGTADVVTDARRRGIDVTIIWPSGSERDSQSRGVGS